MEHRLNHPFTQQQVSGLKLGDIVYVNGKITYSAGLPTFQRLVKYVEINKDLPVDLHNGALFNLGSNSRRVNGKDKVIYVNPTTSARFNPYKPVLIRKLNLKLIGGKGGLGPESVAAMKEVGCVYLSFIGGGAPIFSRALKGEPLIHWTDLVPHYRLTTIKVNELGPLVVAIDAHGNSIYEQSRVNLRLKFPEIIKDFEPIRG